ncbi:unnamed protein product, partial [Iphiclides podalirius]
MNRLLPVNSLSKRLSNCSYSKCAEKPGYGPPPVQRTVMLNGNKVAAARHLGAPIGACTIMFQVSANLGTCRTD